MRLAAFGNTYTAHLWLLTVPRVGNIYLCQEKRILLFVV